MFERRTLTWLAPIAGLFGALLVLWPRRRKPPARVVPAEPVPAVDPGPPVPPARPAKAPPFGSLACLALVIAVAGGGGWLYHQRMGRIRTAAALAGGDATHAPALLRRYGCASCHQISGVPSSGGLVGPPLDGISARVYIAGMLPNTPDNLVRWIVDPRAVNPHTAMPVTGITPGEARDVAAYLYGR